MLSSTTISKMISESLQDLLGYIPSCFCYRTTHHLYPWIKPNRVGCKRVCVRSLTMDRRWADNMLISGGNHHFTNWFYGVVLGSTTIFITSLILYLSLLKWPPTIFLLSIWWAADLMRLDYMSLSNISTLIFVVF